MKFEDALAQGMADKFSDIEIGNNEETVQETTQEPTVEQQEESSLTPTEPTKTISEDDMSKVRAEIEQKLREEMNAQQPQYANERIKKLDELARSGVDIDSDEFWKWQYLDIDKLNTSNVNDALQIARLELEIENPQLNTKQIDRMLKKRYSVLFDDMFSDSDTEYQEMVEDLSIDAIRGVTKLKKHKEQLELPKVDLKQREIDQQARTEAQQSFNKQVKEVVQSYNDEPIKLDKDLEIKYILSNDAKKFIESSMVNNQTWFMDNYVKDNNIDYNRLRRDMARIYDFDNIVKAVYEQGISVGKNSVVDSLENSSLDISSQKQQISKSLSDQILEQFALQNTRKRN